MLFYMDGEHFECKLVIPY